MRTLKFMLGSMVLSLSCFLSFGEEQDDLLSVSMANSTDQLKPGEKSWLLIEVNLKPDWHAYWKTAGQTGFPTTMEWDLPEEVSVGPLKFPSPEYYEYEGLGSYVHKGTFILMAELHLAQDTTGFEPLEITGKFSTLLCNESNCIPFDRELSISLKVGNKTIKNARLEPSLAKAKSKWPIVADRQILSSAKVDKNLIELSFKSQKFKGLATDQFYFFPENDFFVHAARQKFDSDENGTSLKLQFKRESGTLPPDRLQGILDHPKFERSFRIDLQKNNITYGTSSVADEFSPASEASEMVRDYKLLWLLLAFVLVGLAVWIYGRTNQIHQPKHTKNLGRALALLVLVFAAWMIYPKKPSQTGSINWKSWTPDLESSLREQGKAVYVDFTAKWCMICQVNKRVFLSSEIIEQFNKKEIVPLLADWTKKGPEILASLQSFGREGVPLNVYYPASGGKGVPLPEVLTKEIVLSVLENEEPYLIAETSGFLSVIGFAFLGGLILNLMPCVFPVLGLKIMSFVKQSGEEQSKIKKHGMVFSIGVLLSFWALLGVLLVLRETLQAKLGWGFQLQEPAFVLVLAVFLFVFALSLSGVLDIGSSLGGLGAKASASKGYRGSFFSGVLATVVATPCMAPFLGAAVGAALTMDWFAAYAVFSCIALGLSFPYLSLSFYPAWISKLPKPGAWMETFKEFMAFPLYATVAWLLWTLQSLL